jgi:hypothetical protein
MSSCVITPSCGVGKQLALGVVFFAGGVVTLTRCVITPPSCVPYTTTLCKCTQLDPPFFLHADA